MIVNQMAALRAKDADRHERSWSDHLFTGLPGLVLIQLSAPSDNAAIRDAANAWASGAACVGQPPKCA